MTLVTITAEEYDSWEPIPTAKARVKDRIGYERACTEINRRIAMGSLRAAARERFTAIGGIVLFTEVQDVWRIQKPSFHMDVWTTGSYDVTISRHSSRPTDVQCQAIRVEPAGIDLLLADAGHAPNRSVQAPSAPTHVNPDIQAFKSKGGAPRKSWWDDLWIEVLREIETGKLTADTFKNAKLLEFHLTEIVEKQSEGKFFPGESTCQPMAQKILKYLKEARGK